VFHGGPVDLDPFLALTDFHMSSPTFAPHPHAGFSAVTYMFRDSAGSFRNRDSLGDVSHIGPGDLHWTQAASGMLHEEVPTEAGVDCHGLQLFVNLRASHKHASPRAFHVDATDVPVVRPRPDVTVRVVAGEAFGVSSPLTGLLTPVTVLDVELLGGAEQLVPVSADQRAVILVVDGAVTVAGHRLPRHAVASLDGPETAVALTAAERATCLVLIGTPIGEPVLFGGPFCMNTEAELADAELRFRTGRMGHLTRSF
jgi:redox-sensitive bicupin YhaK (pirin superfamily)